MSSILPIHGLAARLGETVALQCFWIDRIERIEMIENFTMPLNWDLFYSSNSAFPSLNRLKFVVIGQRSQLNERSRTKLGRGRYTDRPSEAPHHMFCDTLDDVRGAPVQSVRKGGSSSVVGLRTLLAISVRQVHAGQRQTSCLANLRHPLAWIERWELRLIKFDINIVNRQEAPI